MAIGSRVGAGNACGNGTGSPSSGGGDACSGKEIAAVWPIVADGDGTAGSTAIGAGWTTGGSSWPSGPGTIGVAPGVCGGTVWITGGALCTTEPGPTCVVCPAIAASEKMAGPAIATALDRKSTRLHSSH